MDARSSWRPVRLAASSGVCAVTEREVVRCARCRELIGVYEPARVILDDGTELRGSLLTLRPELQAAGSIAVHEGCDRVVPANPQNG